MAMSGGAAKNISSGLLELQRVVEKLWPQELILDGRWAEGKAKTKRRQTGSQHVGMFVLTVASLIWVCGLDDLHPVALDDGNATGERRE